MGFRDLRIPGVAEMTQFVTYGQIPEVVQELVANKISLLDQYILIQTDTNEFTALVRNTGTGDVVQWRFYWDMGSGVWFAEQTTGAAWDWSVSNEVYCYSNVGVGAALDLPVVSGATAYATVFMCCALMFAIAFKGALYPVLRGKRRGF